MKTLTFEEYQTAESIHLKLNDAGKAYIKEIVEEYANFEWRGDESQIEALSSSDNGFDDDGCMHLELPGMQTKSGTPYTYELDFEEHFDAWEAEL